MVGWWEAINSGVTGMAGSAGQLDSQARRRGLRAGRPIYSF